MTMSKIRRRSCDYKDVTVSTSEYDKIVKDCHSTPVSGNKYCGNYAFVNNDESKTSETSIQLTANERDFLKERK